MYYCYVKDGEYIIGIASSSLPFAEMVSEAEANNVKNLFLAKPADPSDNWQYKLRADNLEWELVELPPEPEPDVDPAEAMEILFGGGGE